MKRFVLILIPLLVLSCESRTYRIEGRYSTEDGTPVYLIDLQMHDTLGMTSVADSTFFFSGKLADGPAFVYVGQGRERVRFILEGGSVNVDLDERSEQGTPMVDAYNSFHSKFYSFDAERNVERKSLEQRSTELSSDDFMKEWDAVTRKYVARQADLADSLVRANCDNLLGALALEDLSYKDMDRFLDLYELSGETVKDFPAVAARYKSIMVLERTSSGNMFTDYEIPSGNLDGSMARLSDYIGKGKYILLDHWASWCGPCKAEMPYLKKTYEAFAGDWFDIVGLAINDKQENTLDAIDELGLPWNQIYNVTTQPGEFYGINSIPHLILFAPDGTILARGIRGEQIFVTVSEALKDR